jgi:hypothetical protein
MLENLCEIFDGNPDQLNHHQQRENHYNITTLQSVFHNKNHQIQRNSIKRKFH